MDSHSRDAVYIKSKKELLGKYRNENIFIKIDNFFKVFVSFFLKNVFDQHFIKLCF